MNKILVWTAICVSALGLIANAPVHAQATCTPQGIAYITIDGASAFVPAQDNALVKNHTVVCIHGMCIGAGKGFIDVRTADGRTVRCDWAFLTVPQRDAALTLVGTLTQPGRLNVTWADLQLTIH